MPKSCVDDVPPHSICMSVSMPAHVCMHVRTHVRAPVYIHVYTHVYTHMSAHVFIHRCAEECASGRGCRGLRGLRQPAVRMPAHMSMRMSTHMFDACRCTFLCTFLYTPRAPRSTTADRVHVYTYFCTHVCTHFYAHVCTDFHAHEGFEVPWT